MNINAAPDVSVGWEVGTLTLSTVISAFTQHITLEAGRKENHEPFSWLRPWLHETGTNSDRYDFRSVSIQMLVSAYNRPVWKTISCRFHSFRLLNRHEWLGPVWSRTTELCKHKLIWDRSKITVLSMRMSVVGPFQDGGKQELKSLKKIKLVGFLGIQWLRIWLNHWKHQRPNMKVEVLTSKEILWSCIHNCVRQCQRNTSKQILVQLQWGNQRNQWKK